MPNVILIKTPKVPEYRLDVDLGEELGVVTLGYLKKEYREAQGPAGYTCHTPGGYEWVLETEKITRYFDKLDEAKRFVWQHGDLL